MRVGCVCMSASVLGDEDGSMNDTQVRCSTPVLNESDDVRRDGDTSVYPRAGLVFLPQLHIQPLKSVRSLPTIVRIFPRLVGRLYLEEDASVVVHPESWPKLSGVRRLTGPRASGEDPWFCDVAVSVIVGIRVIPCARAA